MTSGYQGRMVRRLEPDPPKPPPEPEEIFLFEEYTAQLVYVHGGEDLHEGATYNDFYGEMKCIPAAIQEARTHCEHFKITPESSLLLEVRLLVHQVKKRKTGKKQYFHPEQDEYEAIPYSAELSKTEVVWSSKEPDKMPEGVPE